MKSSPLWSLHSGKEGKQQTDTTLKAPWGGVTLKRPGGAARGEPTRDPGSWEIWPHEPSIHRSARSFQPRRRGPHCPPPAPRLSLQAAEADTSGAPVGEAGFHGATAAAGRRARRRGHSRPTQRGSCGQRGLGHHPARQTAQPAECGHAVPPLSGQVALRRIACSSAGVYCRPRHITATTPVPWRPADQLKQ